MPEDWGDEQRFPLKKAILVILLVGALVGSAFAVYKITSPPSPEVVITTPATLSAPTVNATSGVVGDTIQISTTLSDAMDGLQVFFYENGASIGSAYTGSGGIAIFNRVVNAAGNYTYTADCMHP